MISTLYYSKRASPPHFQLIRAALNKAGWISTIQWQTINQKHTCWSVYWLGKEIYHFSENPKERKQLLCFVPFHVLLRFHHIHWLSTWRLVYCCGRCIWNIQHCILLKKFKLNFTISWAKAFCSFSSKPNLFPIIKVKSMQCKLQIYLEFLSLYFYCECVLVVCTFRFIHCFFYKAALLKCPNSNTFVSINCFLIHTSKLLKVCTFIL